MLQRPGSLEGLRILRVEHRLHIVGIFVQSSVEECHLHGKGFLQSALVTVMGKHFETMGNEILFLVQAAFFEGIGLASLIFMAHRGLRRKARNYSFLSPVSSLLFPVIAYRLRQSFSRLVFRRHHHRSTIRVETHIRIVTHQATGAHRRGDIVNTDGQLRRIEIVELRVGVQIELHHLRFPVALRILPLVAFDGLTDEFHTPSVSTHECQHRIVDHRRLVTDFLCRLAVWQIIDLQQDKAVVDVIPLLTILVFDGASETDAGQFCQFTELFTTFQYACPYHLNGTLERIAGKTFLSVTIVDECHF